MKKIMISAILAAAAMGASAGQAVKSPIFTDELGTTVLTADPSKVVSNVNGSVYTDELGTMVEYSNPTQSVGNVANASAATASAPSKNKGILSNTYGEVGYGTISVNAGGASLSTGVVRAVVGKELTPNFSVEGHISAGTGSAVQAVKLDSAVGVFVKAKYEIMPSLDVFARAGYNRINATVLGVSGHDSGGAYSAGASYALTKTSSVGLDYSQLYSKDGLKVNTTIASYKLKF
jgi:hypothetical protein